MPEKREYVYTCSITRGLKWLPDATEMRRVRELTRYDRAVWLIQSVRRGWN